MIKELKIIKFLEKKKLKEMAKRQTKKKKNQPAKQKNPIPICHTNQPGKGGQKNQTQSQKKNSVSSKKC